jgi:hypothetical protein
MHRLALMLLRELTYTARECLKWTLISVVYLISLWFLIEGLPRMVAMINGRIP